VANEVLLRPPLPSDAAALAALAAELGYPTDAADVPTGWCHVEMRRTLVEPQSALIVGLVTGEGHRSAGIGAELVAAAERWARARGCRRLVVATRITRERAHRFYAREGYVVNKTSYFLTKPLD